MDEQPYVEGIARDLRELGVKLGDTILVHSSLKSLGTLPGGPGTVVQGLLTAVGSAGSLLMPALSHKLKPPEIYDVRRTLSIIGAIPEYFRTRAGTLRSMHPTHSVCAVGKRAESLLVDHARDSTPCGANSPYHKNMEVRGKIIMLGCGLKPNTSMHALEEYAEPLYLYGQSLVFTLTDWSGKTYQKEYRTHGFVEYRQRYDRVADLSAAGFIRRGRVLEADTFVLEAAGLKDAVLDKLDREPLYFVDKKPLENRPGLG